MLDVLKVPLSHPTIIFESLYITRSCVPFSNTMSSSVLAASSSALLLVHLMPSLKNDFVLLGKRSHPPVPLIPGLSLGVWMHHKKTCGLCLGLVCARLGSMGAWEEA